MAWKGKRKKKMFRTLISRSWVAFAAYWSEVRNSNPAHDSPDVLGPDFFHNHYLCQPLNPIGPCFVNRNLAAIAAVI